MWVDQLEEKVSTNIGKNGLCHLPPQKHTTSKTVLVIDVTTSGVDSIDFIKSFHLIRYFAGVYVSSTFFKLCAKCSRHANQYIVFSQEVLIALI